jgi:hypothetical protein
MYCSRRSTLFYNRNGSGRLRDDMKPRPETATAARAVNCAGISAQQAAAGMRTDRQARQRRLSSCYRPYAELNGTLARCAGALHRRRRCLGTLSWGQTNK